MDYKPQPISKPIRQPQLDRKALLDYIPHGIDDEIFKPLSLDNPGETIEEKDDKGNIKKYTEFEKMLEFKKDLLGNNEYNFIVFFNNRNIRRKMPGDIILAFKSFCDMLSEEEKEKVLLIMHTTVIDENGTDLLAVKDAIASEENIIFSNNKVTPQQLNYMYNIIDVTINMASNEGYGLATAESLMTGTPIIANVTGGLQDQMGFKIDDEYIDPHKHLKKDWSTNHDKRLTNNGDWVYPLFPTNRSLAGSPPTPYIFDDRCSWEDAAKGMKYWYDKTEDERKEAGIRGLKYMKDTGMTAIKMGLRFINYIDKTIENFSPKKRFNLYKL